LRRPFIIVSAIVLLGVGGLLAVQWRSRAQESAELLASVARAMALAQSEEGLSDAAVELENVLKRSPDFVPALLARGEVCLRLSRWNDAIEPLRHASELTGGSESEGRDHARAQLLLGRALAERYRGTSDDGDFRGARFAFQDARKAPEFEADAIQGYAMLYLQKGRHRDFKKVLASFDELLQKHPDYPDAPSIRERVDDLRAKYSVGE